MRYFDAHCHIQFDPYDEDREELIARMSDEGVGGLVVGVDMESSKRAIALVEGRDNLHASVGLHPNDVSIETFDAAAYRALAAHPKVRAIGECGLDYFRPADVDAAKDKQKEVLEQQIQIAIDLDKPLMIHARPSKGMSDTYHDLIDLLGSYKHTYGDRLRGDIHFYVGGVEEAKALASLDFTLSFTGVVTFARDYDEVIQTLPATHLLSETDCPYVAPASRRGQRNDPLSIPEIVSKLAEIRSEDPETLRATILDNSFRLFGL